MKRLLLVLILCAPAWGANIFTGDANCVALWNFENGALTTDSISTNTLLANGVIFTPTAETVDYKQGSACVDLEAGTVSQGGAYLSILDSSLSSDFPIKASYANTVQLSVCYWFKAESLPSGATNDDRKGLFSKWDWAGDHDYVYNSFLYFDGSNPVVGTSKGYNSGADSESSFHSTVLQTGRWYHLGTTYDDSTKLVRMRLWDDTAKSVVDVTDTQVQSISLTTEALRVGLWGIYYASRYEFDGLVDEMVVFNDILTADEIDAIRSGTYGSAAESTTSNWWWRRRHN